MLVDTGDSPLKNLQIKNSSLSLKFTNHKFNNFLLILIIQTLENVFKKKKKYETKKRFFKDF